MVLLVGCLPPAPMDGKSKKGADEGYDPLEPLPEFERSGPTPEDAPPPNPNAYVVPERGEAETPSEYDDLLDDVFVQFKAENFKKIEKYRKKLTPTHVAEFVNQWDPKLPWDVKNGFVHLLVDRDEVGVGRIMSDGLKSPREHIRESAAAWIEASNPPVIAAEEAPVIAAEEAPESPVGNPEHGGGGHGIFGKKEYIGIMADFVCVERNHPEGPERTAALEAVVAKSGLAQELLDRTAADIKTEKDAQEHLQRKIKAAASALCPKPE